METLGQDLRFALRTLRRGWGVTAIAVASLALAIGGNTAVFALIDTLLLQPISVAEPERLVMLQERRVTEPDQLGTLAVSLASWNDYRERVRSVESWAAYRPATVGLRGDGRTDPVRGARVTSNFFEVTGVVPGRGRTFTPAEAVEGGAAVAVVSPEFWTRTRGGEGDPVGQVLVLDGEPHEVVGVLPEDFNLLFFTGDLLLPLRDDPLESPRDRRNVLAIGRMRDGATMDQVRGELRAVASQLGAEHPLAREWTTDAYNVRNDLPDTRTKIFYGLLQGSVFFVLLIACANIMNLLLARGQERRREIALRTVLGAERGRVVRQLLTESALLVAAGAALGLALGWYGIRLMEGRIADVVSAGFELEMGGRTLLFTLGVSVLAGLVFGVVPALQTFSSGQSAVLKGGGKSSAGRGTRFLTRGLVVAEIALSLVALGGGGLLVRTFLGLRSADPGFDGSAVVVAPVRIPPSRYGDDEQLRVVHERLLDRARGVGGVTEAALVDAVPQNFQAPSDTFRIRGAGGGDGEGRTPEAYSVAASPGFARVFGIQMIQGRFFEEGDGPDAAPVMVVNRAFVERFLPEGGAVGRTVWTRGADREIVGVMEDITQVAFPTPGGLGSEAVYVPAAQVGGSGYTVVVRAAGDAAVVKEPLRRALQEVDVDLTLSPVRTMVEVVDGYFAGVEIFNAILGGFGVLALLLASVGTYGVLAYSVDRRSREIGIRMAVGAERGAIVRMVARQGIVMAILGLGIGGVFVVPLTALVRNLMAGFAEVQASTPAFVAVLLFAVTVAASVVPALRAAAVSPVRALRVD